MIEVPTDWEVFTAGLHVRNPDRQASQGDRLWVPFEDRPGQANLIQAIESAPQSKIAIYAERKLGLTTALCSWLLMRSLTDPSFTALFFCPTLAAMAVTMRYIHDMIGTLPIEVHRLTVSGKDHFGFLGHGLIKFLVPPDRNIPRFSASVAIFDNAEHMDIGLITLHYEPHKMIVTSNDQGFADSLMHYEPIDSWCRINWTKHEDKMLTP